MFPNLTIVFNLLLILPFSNACVQRVFSKVKLIQTDLRKKLETDRYIDGSTLWQRWY